MIERDGEIVWYENEIYGGIRQDLTDAERRYRLVQNGHMAVLGALTKDLGIRLLSSENIGSATLDSVKGFDAHFDDGTQKLMLFVEASGGNKVYTFASASRTYGSAHAPTFAADSIPDVVQFANKAYVFEGTTLRAMDSAETWTTPGSATYSDPCTHAEVFANRLVASGNASFPYSFFPSGVRDGTDWDLNIAQDVVGSRGDRIRCVKKIGPYLTVGGRTFTRMYTKGEATAVDWDFDELSAQVGPMDFKSYVEVPQARGNDAENFAFFWSEQGPMMVAQFGRSTPTLHELWPAIRRAVRGTTYEDLPGFAPERFEQIVAIWLPHLQEVRFALTTASTFSTGGEIRNDLLLCLNVPSAIRHAQDPENFAPFFRIRNNDQLQLPCSTAFTARVDSTGLLSATGQPKAFIGSNGQFYEMDAPSVFDDNGTSIPFKIVRSGYNGKEDGVTFHTKDMRKIWVHGTQVGSGELTAFLRADGGARSQQATLSLDVALSLWTTDVQDGAWGDGGTWNAGEITLVDAEPSTIGKVFDLTLSDNGSIAEPFELDAYLLMGYLEDRR